MSEQQLKVIARIHTDFPEKFGIPRQSNLIEGLKGTIVFEPEYRNPDALRGIGEYDYLWLLWGFEGTDRGSWKPMVRPPRLGGNERRGVFATRSPFRPNPVGLSSVKLEGLEQTGCGLVIHVSGVDMKDGTPIYDIKPYLPYVDSHPQARGGFAHEMQGKALEVDFSEELLKRIPSKKQEALIQVLRQDPRPHYQSDPERIYGFPFDQYEIKFRVEKEKLIVVNVT